MVSTPSRPKLHVVESRKSVSSDPRSEPLDSEDTERMLREELVFVSPQIYAPPKGETWDMFPKITKIEAGTEFIVFDKKSNCAFFILQGQAAEFGPDEYGNLDVANTMRELGPRNLVYPALFLENSDYRSPIMVKAMTDIIAYEMIAENLEALDVVDSPPGSRESARRKRERFIRAALARESDPLHSGRMRLHEHSRMTHSQNTELNQLLRMDLKDRVERVQKVKLKQLSERISELEPWLEAAFEHVPRILKDRKVDAESVRILIETLQALTQEQGEEIDMMHKEVDELYRTLRSRLEAVLMTKHPHLNVVDLLGEVDEFFHGIQSRRKI